MVCASRGSGIKREGVVLTLDGIAVDAVKGERDYLKEPTEPPTPLPGPQSLEGSVNANNK